jgi:hypothetical protein
MILKNNFFLSRLVRTDLAGYQFMALVGVSHQIYVQLFFQDFG